MTAVVDGLAAIVTNLAASLGVPLFGFLTLVVLDVFVFPLLVAAGVRQHRRLRERQRQEEEARRQHEADKERRKEEQRRREEEERQERQHRGIFQLCLRPNTETFTPVPLPLGKHYRITLRGVYRYTHWFSRRQADAAYYSDPYGNFTIPYRNLFFDGKPVQPIAEDRHAHWHELNYTGTARKLSLLIKPPKDFPLIDGALEVSIAPVPAEELARAEEEKTQAEHAKRAQKQAEEMKQEQDRQAALDKQRQAEQERKRRKHEEDRRAKEKREGELQHLLKDYRGRAHADANLLEPEYRKNLACVKTEQVLAQRQQYQQDYEIIMQGRDEDGRDWPELPAMIREQAPEVLTWFQAWREMILLAEQIIVKPVPRAREREKRPKPREDAIRAYKRYVIRRSARDKSGVRMEVFDMAREFEAGLTQKYPEMPQDEIQKHVRDFIDELLDELQGDRSQGMKLE